MIHRDEIVRFDPIKNTWRQLGKLLTSRQGHGVIQVDDDFIVVNGHSWTYSFSGKTSNELCKLKGKSMICTAIEPRMYDFKYYPELMLIP